MNIPSEKIFSIGSTETFNRLAIEIFRYQLAKNVIYAQFVTSLRIDESNITSIEQIPFMPIEFFKSHKVVCEYEKPLDVTFSSSGTTGVIQSRHFVSDINLYEQSFKKGFDLFYGDIKNYIVLALLPSYLEREGSSLIYMVDSLIRESEDPLSGYFLYNHKDLHQTLLQLKNDKRQVILIGVTYALLDFIETYKIDFPELIVMETGGMKGKRKEMIREELHFKLKNGFGVNEIHSEYGMTELLSQAYSKENGIFSCPPWMKVLVRDINDPLTYMEAGRTGGLNVIDLANLHSCSFIATQDLGKLHENGTFEVAGRFDNSDIRGCNLLVQ